MANKPQNQREPRPHKDPSINFAELAPGQQAMAHNKWARKNAIKQPKRRKRGHDYSPSRQRSSLGLDRF